LRLIEQGLGYQRVKLALRRHDDLDALAASIAKSVKAGGAKPTGPVKAKDR
jgi:hypothetical protein